MQFKKSPYPREATSWRVGNPQGKKSWF